MISINAPTRAGTIRVTGEPVTLTIGRSEYHFIIQHALNGNRDLTHYQSGISLGSLTWTRFTQQLPPEMPDIEVAEQVILARIEQYGEPELHRRLNTAHVLNPLPVPECR